MRPVEIGEHANDLRLQEGEVGLDHVPDTLQLETEKVVNQDVSKPGQSAERHVWMTVLHGWSQVAKRLRQRLQAVQHRIASAAVLEERLTTLGRPLHHIRDRFGGVEETEIISGFHSGTASSAMYCA